MPTPRRRAPSAAAVCLLLATSLLASPVRSAGAEVSVIVRALPGAGGRAERAVLTLGGRVGLRLGIINGFSARLPASNVADLVSSPGVSSVTPDASVHPLDVSGPSGDRGSMDNVTRLIKAQELWKDGITGRGVDVALIDTGVVPVDGLTVPGKIANGPDISFDSQVQDLRYLDANGHGTHMAGIIAGRDDEANPEQLGEDAEHFMGVAPEARIVSVKVGSATGATDVSQVIAAIDWVVQHRNSDGLNIRVLNLSFGTDGAQDPTIDPLAHAAEVAWRRGIVVVVAAGNAGLGSGRLSDPATDPYVIAVGADDTKGTDSPGDDEVPAWSSPGDPVRHPDVVAPGTSIISLRDPGSDIDLTHPEGRVGDRFFRGSGTSQAAAVVSGAAALIIQQRPSITPDQVKALLTSTATRLPAADPIAQGAGLVNLRNAERAPTPPAEQTWPLSTGTGSLELARGSAHLVLDGQPLSGERDIFGAPWEGVFWSGLSWSGLSWSGGTWNGNVWSGSCWCESSWSGLSWSGLSWSGLSWSGLSWSGLSWSSNTWDGLSWSGLSWSGIEWGGADLSGLSWSSQRWGT